MAAKKPKPEPRPTTPGKLCPNCGEERESPSPGDGGTYPGWEKWVEFPHENPFDCIRSLKKQIESSKEDIRSVTSEVASIEAPRNERF